MKRLFVYLSALLCLMFVASGCGSEAFTIEDAEVVLQQLEELASEESSDETVIMDLEPETEEEEAQNTKQPDADASENEVTSSDSEEASIDEEGAYTSRDEVALYIHTYGKLPKNFITKQEAEALGWNSKEGNLHEVAPGMSIGGNKFGNYEKQLPDGRYKECDINYTGGYRGGERIVYSESGEIYYTDDHYATFTQLY